MKKNKNNFKRKCKKSLEVKKALVRRVDEIARQSGLKYGRNNILEENDFELAQSLSLSCPPNSVTLCLVSLTVTQGTVSLFTLLFCSLKFLNIEDVAIPILAAIVKKIKSPEITAIIITTSLIIIATTIIFLADWKKRILKSLHLTYKEYLAIKNLR